MTLMRRRLAPALVAAGLVLVLDQVSKWLVGRAATDLPIDIGPVSLHPTFNSGISFSRLADAGSVVVVLVACMAAAVAVALVVVPPRYRLALGIALGGALGNLVDRLRFGGAVVDFIVVWRWPSFNVADAAILLGAALLVVQVLRASRA